MTTLRDRLRLGLTVEMKARNRAAVAALRQTLAAIDNAEAVDSPAGVRAGAIESSAVGLAAAEMARRELTEADVERIARTELAELEAAALDFEQAGRPERAADLRAGAAALSARLDDV